MPSQQSQVTQLLQRWSNGDGTARDELIPVVYQRLHELAHFRLREAPGERSLNTTALVHEAYVKFVDSPRATFQNRQHFLAIASRVMRNVLVDHARARNASKRGGGRATLELRDEMWVGDIDLDAVTELDQALKKLAELDERQSEIIEHRYFGGLSLEETAEAMGISLATVKRELRSARAWLAIELAGAEP